MAAIANPKRIEHQGAEAGEAAIVARHEREAIGHGGRREQAVDDRDSPDGADAPPLAGNRIVDTEHATVECGLDLMQPSFQRRRLVWISCARKLNPLADLAENERAQKEVFIPDRSVPSRNIGVAPVALRTSEMMLVSIRELTDRRRIRSRGRDPNRSPRAARTQGAPSGSLWAARQNVVE
jgi:hypothetical protein